MPIAVLLTGANVHDVTQLLELVDAVPEISGKVGAPRYRFEELFADRAYDSSFHREALLDCGITPMIPKREQEHGSGLGVFRWVVERTLSWLHQFKRLRIRYERRADMHEAFMALGCSVICWRALDGSFC